jgi:hypothetical protein
VDIKRWIVSEFKRRGFKKNGRIFEKRGNESTLCVSTHKSRFSQDHFIDCGVILDGFVPRDNQYSHFWSIFCRIEDIFADSEKRSIINSALDGEVVMVDVERQRIVFKALDEMERRMEEEWSNREWMVAHAPLKHVGGFHFNERFVKECINSRENMS